MPSELICNLRGGWRRQVGANAVARQEFLIALQELDEAQQELAEFYAAKKGHTDGKFTFEQRETEIVLVRVLETPAE